MALYHYFGTATNDKNGAGLPGWYVELVLSSDLSTVQPIYADENSTAISSLSGVTNRAKSDASGNFDFFATKGVYGLRYYNGDGVFQFTQRYVQLGESFTNSGGGAKLRALVDKTQEIVRSVADYEGWGGTSAQNLSAIKLALAACAAGDVLDVPPGTFLVDTSVGLSNAPTVSTSITIRMRGSLQATSQAIGATPAPILNITADNVTIEGDGKFIGPGTTNSVNTGTDDTIPSLVRVTGNKFTMRGVTFDTPFKVGLLLYGCFDALIEGTKFTGGPTTYTDTAYFGIRMSNSGGRHAIKSNRFFPSASGGMLVNCIFSNGAGNCNFDDNTAYRPYEKLLYLAGDGHTVNNNRLTGNTGTIPGTNQTGTVGEGYRLAGTNCKVTKNYSIYAGGGITVRIGGGHLIEGNQLLECGQSGITLIGTSAVLDNSKISNNLISCGNLSGVLVTNGIQVITGTGTNRRVHIAGNTVSGFGIADPIANIPTWQASTSYAGISTTKPTVANSRYYIGSGGVSGASQPTWPTTPGATVVDGTITWTCVAYDTLNAAISFDGSAGGLTSCKIDGNIVSGGYYGLKTASMTASVVNGNILDATNTGVLETSGGTNRYIYNTVQTAGTERTGLAGTSTWVN